MGYKTPFDKTPSAPKPKAEQKKKKKSWFQKWGERQGDAAADHLLDMHKKKKK